VNTSPARLLRPPPSTDLRGREGKGRAPWRDAVLRQAVQQPQRLCRSRSSAGEATGP